jgi:hypothetical protein
MSGITIPFKVNYYIGETLKEERPDLEEGSAEYLEERDSRVSALVRSLTELIPRRGILTSSELDIEIQKRLDLWVAGTQPDSGEISSPAHITPRAIVTYAREQVLVDTPDIDQTSAEYGEAVKNKEIEVIQSIIAANPFDEDTMTDSDYDMLIKVKLTEWRPPQ